MGKISSAEVDYIRDGIAEGVRGDGRTNLQYRRIVVECDTIPQSNGSASCSIGDTKVLVAVKADIGVPFPEAPDQGELNCLVDISPCALQGPHTDAQGASLARKLHSSLRWQNRGSGSALDLQKLSIVSGKRCWVLSVEGLVISVGGNVLGALSIATKAALGSLRIPHVDVDMGEDGMDPELDLDDDMEKAMSLDTSRVPLIITISTANGKDVTDLTEEEELACQESSIHIAVTQKGGICSIEKAGRQSIPPENFLAKMRVAQSCAGQLFRTIDAQIKQ